MLQLQSTAVRQIRVSMARHVLIVVTHSRVCVRMASVDRLVPSIPTTVILIHGAYHLYFSNLLSSYNYITFKIKATTEELRSV